jgi:heme exporter protein A
VVFDFETVTLRNVSRNFGRRRALHRIDLECAAGQVTGLLGPNGAGKSTLLSILSTLIAPSSGDVRYGGKSAAEAGAGLRAKLGVLGHDLYVYPELTARENLVFFARLYGMPDGHAAVDLALERARLADRADDLVSGFSRGMRQRLALERAVLHGPRLLLLDEPFTGLDDASGQGLVERLRSLKAAGTIVVAATHDLDLADGLLDRAVVLREGRMLAVQDGSEHLRERYRQAIDAARNVPGPKGRL